MSANRKKSVEGSVKKMKITDLTIDCLEEILGYLNLENLLNVADSNKRLNKAACFVFRRKHGERRVELVHYESYTEPIEMMRENVFVGRLIDHFRVLRCFGCVTSNLVIHFNYDIEHIGHFDRVWSYVNEYCAESLIKLQIFEERIVFEDIKRPFVNIETVDLFGGSLSKNVMQFNKCFPKMSQLKLYKIRKARKCLETHFPNLKYLSYYPRKRKNKRFVPHFEKVIRLNPNLRSIHIYNWSETHLQNISIYLPQLEELIIDKIKDYDKLNRVSGQIHFGRLKRLVLCFERKYSNLLLEPNFIFDQIEYFEVFGIKFEHLLPFVKKYATIKTLKLRYQTSEETRSLDKENALVVAKALPLLSELHLQLYRELTVDDVIHFVDKLKLLRKFHFKLSERTMPDLRAKLDKKWKLSIDSGQIEGRYFIEMCR